MSQDFEKYLDTVFLISKEARKNLGEDSFYCAQSKKSAIVSVYDGCGGLGARKYDSYKNHTGAYLASRTVSGAVHDWYHKNFDKSWVSAERMVHSIDGYIRNAYNISSKYAIENTRIRGSMVRKFPTTMALAYAEADKEQSGIWLHVLWAGDSRVYILDRKGLAQVTMDDTDVEDALENLTKDGALTNVLSSDGKYEIHFKTLHLQEPAIVFAATDGCFGYIPSPMEFEHVILKALVHNSTLELFKKELRQRLAECAGDDLALGLMSFGYGDYKNTRDSFRERLAFLERKYISILRNKEHEEYVGRLWKDYKSDYERYLR